MRKYLFVLLLFPLLTAAQSDEDVLFVVDDRPVTVDEFRYIYTKTNGEEADFSRESVMEYLDLYERFKLKVARARQMGLDTVTALQNELEGYRKQLAESYLVDREVTDRLVENLYARKATDVEFSHLLVKTDGQRPDDTFRAYQRAERIKKMLTPRNFAAMADSLSDDTYSNDRGGRIGYLSAPLPRGMHQVEEALYNAEDGEIVGPVSSPAGYHLLLRHGDRPAYGEVEIAHILIRKQEGRSEEEALSLARQAKTQLISGIPFEEVAARYSEDSQTKNQGGYLGYFGINRYDKTFEEAAFGLQRDGEVSEIVESPAGYHILKRISRRGRQTLDEQAPLLEAAIKKDPRYAEARQALMRGLRDELGVTVDQDNYETFAATATDSAFFTRRDFEGDDQTTLLRIGERAYTTADFADFLVRNSRLRGSLRRRLDPPDAARDLFERWIDGMVETTAEARLEDQYPDFRALMREYREGILLFEATKMEVWDRAGEDTTGLRAYFEAHRDDYTYGARARVLSYTVDTSGGLTFDRIQHFLREGGEPAEFAGEDAIETEEDLYEADRLPEGLAMEAGSTVGPTPTAGGRLSFSRVAEILPPRRKELNEARGYIIADYQDQLEREWVESLREEFVVERNEEVLEGLIEG